MNSLVEDFIQRDQPPFGYRTTALNNRHGNTMKSPSSSSEKVSLRSPAQVKCTRPAVAAMERLFDRIMTFGNWPHRHLPSPKRFSEAGFYNLKSGDRVKCFNCGGGLQGWKPEEDPFYEHAKWFPECEYLQLCKGVDYVKEVKAKHPDLKRPKIHNPVPLNPRLSVQKKVQADDASMVNETSTLDHLTSLEEKVENAMKKDVVEAAVILSSDSLLVRRLVRRKLENDNAEYTSVETLFEDLQKEATETHDEAMECQPSSSGLNPATSSSSHNEISHDSFNRSHASIPAGEVLMMSSFSDVNATSLLPPFPAPPRPATSTPHTPPAAIVPDDQSEESEDEFSEEERCKVCLDKRIDCIFTPCHHLCCCVTCARALRVCPVCRAKIETILKIYRK